MGPKPGLPATAGLGRSRLGLRSVDGNLGSHTPWLETLDTGLAHLSLELIPWRRSIQESRFWCKGTLVTQGSSSITRG